ncbi:MAG: DNA-3-methyladenine glycosylase I [Spirochaetales bacterium]
MQRCSWHNLEKSAVYQAYHDSEWGVASYDDSYLFEMLVLESFHCGLSWLIILNKRQAFQDAFDNFDVNAVAHYDERKINALLQDKNIVRNRAKIAATIANAKAFIAVQREFGSFCEYIWSFTGKQVLYAPDDVLRATNELSDTVAKDFKARGFSFLGSVTTYSFLEAIGIMNNHQSHCFCYTKPALKTSAGKS